MKTETTIPLGDLPVGKLDSSLGGGLAEDAHGVPFVFPSGGGRPIRSGCRRAVDQSRMLRVLLRQPKSRLPLVLRIAERLDNGGWWATQAVRVHFGAAACALAQSGRVV